MEKLTYNNR